MFDVTKPLIDEQSIEKHNLIDSSHNKQGENPDIVGFGESNQTNYINVFLVIILVLFILASGGIYFLKLNKTSQLSIKDEEAGRLEQQLNSPELKQANDQATVFSIGLEKFNSVFNSRYSFKVLLDSLNKTVPNGITLTAFNVDQKFAGKITGTANNDDSVAEFLTALNESDVFSNSNLSSVTRQTSTSQTGSGENNTQVQSQTTTFSIETTIVSSNLTQKAQK